jgi:hypothetical protein
MVRLVHQLTSGMAGWLTFEQMRDGVDNLREGSLEKPIEEIAKGRHFEVKGQFQLPRRPGQLGASQSIDFLMVDRQTEIVVALELKFKRAGKKMAGGMGLDAAKLHQVSIEKIEQQIRAGEAGSIRKSVTGYQLQRAVMVVWREDAIQAQLLREPAIIRTQFERMALKVVPKGIAVTDQNIEKVLSGKIAANPVGCRDGSLRAGSTITKRRFWVASLLHRPAWSKLT